MGAESQPFTGCGPFTITPCLRAEHCTLCRPRVGVLELTPQDCRSPRAAGDPQEV